MNEIRLVHLADIHLGYSTRLVFHEEEKNAGRSVREVDIESAVRRLTKQLCEERPAVDVVVIAGDLFHRSIPTPRAVAYAAAMVRRLVERGIEVIIIDGNHETSSSRHAGSPTSFLRELGAHVFNESYEIVRDNRWQKPDLQNNLAVHALPYRAILAEDLTGVIPLTDRLNVLLTHGRVQGMSDLNTLGRPAGTIPSPLLRKGWNYIALGDWHIHRHQPLSDVPAYYAGSLEALNFGEAVLHPTRENDQASIRGAIDVRLMQGKPPVITSLENRDCRPVLRLRSIEASDMEPEALMHHIRQQLDDQLPAEALAVLEIKACPMDVYERLNHEEIEQLRNTVRYCEIRWEVLSPDVGQSVEPLSEMSVGDQWQDFLVQQGISENEQDWYMQEGVARIEAARKLLRAKQLDTGEE